MKSPQKLFLIFILISLFLAFFLSYAHGVLVNEMNRHLSSTISKPSNDLYTARYYLYTGRISDAVQEYQSVIFDRSSTETNLAYDELRNLLHWYNTQVGHWMGFLVYLTWFASTRLYLFSTVLIPIWLIVLFAGLIKKRPLFAVLPIYDNGGQGEQLHTGLQDRIREILWRAKYPQSANALISDRLEMPVVGMSSEGDSVDTVALLETALNFSFGISNLPLSKLLNSLKLWFDQPNYLVRGYIERNYGNKELHIILVDPKTGNVVRIWNNKIDDDTSYSKLSDSIIYPLLFHFSDNLQANNWEALQALHEGLENFQISQEHRDASEYISRAQSCMERALALDPGYLLARYNIGFIALTIGDYDKAREQFREASLISKEIHLGIRATYNYGVALFHIAQDWAYHRAAETFESLLMNEQVKKDKFDMLIRSNLALTYAKMAGRPKNEKEELVNRVISETGIILASHDSSLEAKANSYASLGYANLAINNKEVAIRSFKQAVELAPNNVMTLLGLGDVYIKTKCNDDAVAVLRRAEMLSPMSGYASYRVGNLYREMGEIDRAIEALQRASGLSVARVALGKIYQNNGSYQEALDEFREAVRINQRQTEAWVNIAWTILLIHDPAFYSEAERAARRAAQLERNENQRWHRYAVLAKCLLASNKNEPALHEANNAVKFGPDKAQAYCYRAEAQYRLKQYSQAKDSITKAINYDRKRELTTEIELIKAKIDNYMSENI